MFVTYNSTVSACSSRVLDVHLKCLGTSPGFALLEVGAPLGPRSMCALENFETFCLKWSHREKRWSYTRITGLVWMYPSSSLSRDLSLSVFRFDPRLGNYNLLFCSMLESQLSLLSSAGQEASSSLPSVGHRVKCNAADWGDVTACCITGPVNCLLTEALDGYRIYYSNISSKRRRNG